MKTLGAVLAAAIIGIPAAVVLSAQARDGDSAISRELVNEVRALRGVIERYADAQIQTQAMTGLMDVQQRRQADVNARLDALRRELGEASQQMNKLTQELASYERMTENALVKAGVSLDDSRREVEALRAHTRHQVEINTMHLQGLQARESELLNQLAAEEAKWNELVGRLDQWMRR
jgi:chromosome segregation ATPase